MTAGGRAFAGAVRLVSRRAPMATGEARRWHTRRYGVGVGGADSTRVGPEHVNREVDFLGAN